MRRAPDPIAAPAERVIHLGSTEITYLLRPSTRSRGIRATIDPRRGLVVSLPPASRRGWQRGEEAVETFLRQRSAWVLRHVQRLERERASAAARGRANEIHYRGELHRIRILPKQVALRRSTIERVGSEAGDELVLSLANGERRSARRLLSDWLRERAAQAIGEAIERHAPALRVRPSKVDLRDPRSRWGSASAAGRLMFSWRLVLAPPASLETVVVHELAHLRVFGHSRHFWDLVATRRPSHLADRGWLRRHSHALHTALDDLASEPELAAG